MRDCGRLRRAQGAAQADEAEHGAPPLDVAEERERRPDAAVLIPAAAHEAEARRRTEVLDCADAAGGRCVEVSAPSAGAADVRAKNGTKNVHARWQQIQGHARQSGSTRTPVSAVHGQR